MAQLFKNNCASTLASGITDSAVSMTLVDASAFPTPGTDWYYVTVSLPDESDWEIVKVTAKSDDVLTIERGQESGTDARLAARAWDAGTQVSLRLTAGTVDAAISKLAGIEAGATADQTAQEIATAIDADATAETTLKSALGLGSAAYTASTDYLSADVPIPALSGAPLLIGVGSPLTITIVDFDSYATYSVAAVEGTATIEDDIITYTGAHVGADTLTVTVNDHTRTLSITVTANYLINPPDAPPAIGAALAGGFYTGNIWDTVCAATGELTLGTGAKALTVPAGMLDFYSGQQLRIAPGPTNAGQVFMFGTVVSRADTTLYVNITSIAGSGTFSNWVIAARYKIILAPKASGENASVQYKTSNDAAPAACFTLTNGVAATAAMVAEGAAYPLAAWVNGINTGAGIGGYTDWYIPARDELALVWCNLKPVTNDNYVTADRYNAAAYTRDANLDDLTQAPGTNRHSDPEGAAYTTSVPGQTSVAVFQSGGAEAMTFGSAYYRTSSEAAAGIAWSQNYSTSRPGDQNGSNKTSANRARAVRRSIL